MDEERKGIGDPALGNYIADQLRKGETRMTNIESEVASLRAEVKTNTDTTAKTSEDVKELLDMFHAVKSGLRVLGGLGAAFRWVGRIAAAGTAIYVAWDLWFRK